MHTIVSDGTDTPEEILARVEQAGIDLFSVTDHDAIRGCQVIASLLTEDSPRFLTGIEFSCKDQGGKYHILGYGYDPQAPAICSVVARGHGMRMEKVKNRLDILREKYGFSFPKQEIEALLKNDNPGKPHIANLMVKYGYAKSMDSAFFDYLNQLRSGGSYVHPKEAITGILQSGGIPVLAHPSYGSGDELFTGTDMDERLRYLMEFGLQGVEAYYSGFTVKLQNEMLAFADKYHLYVTAGSDYHGENKMVVLGDNNLTDVRNGAEGLQRFLQDVWDRVL